MMKELAPGAMGQIQSLIRSKTLEAVTVIPVVDEKTGETTYQNILLTVKDGKVTYLAFLGDECFDEDEAIDVATQWIDHHYYHA